MRIIPVLLLLASAVAPARAQDPNEADRIQAWTDANDLFNGVISDKGDWHAFADSWEAQKTTLDMTDQATQLKSEIIDGALVAAQKDLSSSLTASFRMMEVLLKRDITQDDYNLAISGIDYASRLRAKAAKFMERAQQTRMQLESP